MKDKIKEKLLYELSDIYCYNCANNNMDDCNYDEDRCDGCIRKSMNWYLGEETAEAIAEDIVKMFESNNKNIVS